VVIVNKDVIDSVYDGGGGGDVSSKSQCVWTLTLNTLLQV
jgi:hypothetical protein